MEPSGSFTYEKGEIKQEMRPVAMDVSHQGHEIKMEEDFYSISVVFDVIESAHNFNMGNLYLQTQFNSFHKNQQSITVARTGYLEQKGTLNLLFRDLLGLIPLSSFFIPSLRTQRIKIKIFDKFDNADFGIESLEFLMSNDELQYKEARLIV